MSKQILMVFHQATSSPGLVGQLLQNGGYRLDMRCPAEGDRLPETLDHHEAVVVFGGPMSANNDDTLPFIRAELDWLPLVLDAEKPYLGICLGAQLMARVLGARVFPHTEGRKEIGYFPMQVTPAGLEDFGRSRPVYHWHGEGFEIPSDAVLLAEGDLFPNQAFRYGDTVYGLQFHPEITEAMIHVWTERGEEQLTLPGAQSRSEQLRNHQRYGGAIADWLDEFLWDWLGESALRESA